MRFFFTHAFIGAVVLFFLVGNYTHAQEKQMLSVTPPLFQISSLPSDVWQSSIKVVNGNSYPLTVYAEILNFKPVGEAGQGKFIPVSDAGEGTTLAEWIELSPGPYTIPPEQTKDITFIADIPADASPGGHYAAIIVSTKEPEATGELSVRASQGVTSLFFMRVEGDVNEQGSIREFRVVDSLLDTPEAEFSLRFENKGNVHLQPRGDIVITNMWGTERGTIPVNYQTHYGNVLPESIRDFSFTWKSDFKVTDIGRYKAVATLAYGEDGVKNVSAITYFWVIPVKWTLITLAILATFVWLIVLMVRAYVRRMLILAGVDPEYKKTDTRVTQHEAYRTIAAPIKDGVLDLRRQLHAAEESLDVVTTVMHFVVSYKKFFMSLAALIVIFVAMTLYIQNATQDNQSYEVEIHESGTNATVN